MMYVGGVLLFAYTCDYVSLIVNRDRVLSLRKIDALAQENARVLSEALLGADVLILHIQRCHR